MWGRAVGPIWRLVVTLWIFGYALVDVTATLQGKGPPGLMFLACLPQLASGLAFSALLLMVLAWTDRWPVLLRWPAVGASVLVAGLLQSVFDLAVLMAWARTLIPDWRSWTEWEGAVYLGRVGQVLILYVWTFSLILAARLTIQANDHAREVEARAAALEVANRKAEASALRMQLNPHFMFNALNSVASLVVTGREREAERMIGYLADFLRASLNADPARDVSLAEEAATLRAYLRIEEIRFGRRMQLRMEIAPEAAEARVPGFILQPLAENAVKHGIAPARRPVVLRVAAERDGDRLLMTVENRAAETVDRPAQSCDPAQEPQIRAVGDRVKGSGVGLANTRQRLAVAYGEAAWLTARRLDDGFRAEIGLPFVVAAGDAGGLIDV